MIGLLSKVPIRSISRACTQQIYDEGKTSAACAEALDIVLGHQVTNILSVDFHEPQNSRNQRSFDGQSYTNAPMLLGFPNF